jgi:hypothetical protein
LRRRDPAFSMNRSSQLGQLAFGGARIRGYVAKRKVLVTYIGKVIRAELAQGIQISLGKAFS